MILVAADEAALAKSPASISDVFIPRNCASSAEADPVAPAPMTQTSKVLDPTLSTAAFRLFTGTHRFLDLIPQRAPYTCVVWDAGPVSIIRTTIPQQSK